jgi:hypothetical protein
MYSPKRPRGIILLSGKVFRLIYVKLIFIFYYRYSKMRWSRA